MRLAFTVRKEYFVAIREGTKTREVRRASPYWERRAFNAKRALDNGEEVIATFLCGPMWHRRLVLGVHTFANARTALGRDPSEQGRRDLGNGRVFGFDLGRHVL